MGFKHISVAFLAASLIGCGGGGAGGSDSADTIDTGYTGNTDPATVDQDNSSFIARAAIEGVLQASDVSGVPTGAQISDGLIDQLHAEIRDIVTVQDVPIGADKVIVGSCGGTLTVTTPDQSNNTVGGVYNVSAVYADYCTVSSGSSYVLNGTYLKNTFLRSDNTTSRIVFSFDLTAKHSFAGETNTISYTVFQDCTHNDAGEEVSCVESDNFTGIDGRSYRVENFKGDKNNLTARVYDPDYGYFDVDAASLAYECDNRNFSSGMISIVDSSGEAVLSVNFPDCIDRTVTFGGNAETYPQLFE